MDWVSSNKASKLLGIHSNTLRTWEKKGLIKSYRANNIGQRKYDINSFLSNQTNIKKEKQNICYCRVSSKGQKEELKNQESYLKSKFPDHDIISDIGSGLNYKRKGLRTILGKALQGTLGQVVVTYKDRMCRFGFDLIEFILSESGAEILVLNNITDSPQEEMVKDLTSIIHVFSSRLYGLRKYKNKIKEACKETNEELS